MKEYWCVICEHCHPLITIPVLEYDRTKQRQNPHYFQATCHRCGATSAFDETELEVRKIERVRAFQPADGFRNVSQLMGSSPKSSGGEVRLSLKMESNEAPN